MARENRFEDLDDDEVYARWQDRFNHILNELTYVFSTRRKFRDIQKMFETNEQLRQVGGQAERWIRGIWGRDAVMAVRRELDREANSICLGRLLDEMSKRPRIMNGQRYMAFVRVTDQYLSKMNDEAFTQNGIIQVPGDKERDYLDPDVIRADRRGLEVAAGPVLEYANRLIAHRTPIEELEITPRQINDAIDAMEPVFKKYHTLLTGRALAAIEPVMLYSWKKAFTFAWLVPTLPDGAVDDSRH